MKLSRSYSAILALTLTLMGNLAFAQNKGQVDSINSYWDNLDKKYPNLHKKYETGEIQKPGEIQKAGAINIPRGEKAISRKSAPCSQHFVVGADTLFDFDKSTLTPFAAETLKALAPMIQKLGAHPVRVEGHTDGKGSEEYNQVLSEKRAERVKNWMLENRVAGANAVAIEGFGKRKPVAPNTKPDGSDNAAGRALNRRVEIIVDTCKTVEDLAKAQGGSGATGGGATDRSAASNGNNSSAGADGSLAGANGSGELTSPASLSNSGSGEMNLSGSVDNSVWLPYQNVVSAEELKSGYTNLRVTPFNDANLRFEISLPNDWNPTKLEVSEDVLKNDSTTQVPLAQIEPSKGDAIVEVRYLRVPDNVSLSSFIQKYAAASGFTQVTRQHAQFNHGEVEDALLRKQSEKYGSQFTRLTASRKGPLVMFVASSCPEKDYQQWKKVFAAAALSFDPGK